MANMNTPTTIPAVWYDYIVQAWVRDGRIEPCGHPASMRCPSSPHVAPCCYAGAHAGEVADRTHYTQEGR